MIGLRDRRTAGVRSWIGRAAVAVAVLLALPYGLTLVYAAVPPPASALMLLRRIEGRPIGYQWRPLEAISPHLVRTVVAAEDARICDHNGVEWGVLGELMEEARRDGAPSRGGSTITQQVAKNLFLWPQRSYLRKGLELPLALWIDLTWSKRRVVEVYVNVAEWAPGVYGAEAAAQHHFGKPAARLTRQEAAQLAAALPNPIVRDAGRPGPQTRRTAAKIRKRVDATVPYLACLRLGE